MSNLHKNVRQEIGLLVVIGAFVAAWFTTSLPSLKASLVTADTVVSIGDADNDGVADAYDVR